MLDVTVVVRPTVGPLQGKQVVNLLLNPKYELGMKLSQEYYAFKRR